MEQNTFCHAVPQWELERGGNFKNLPSFPSLLKVSFTTYCIFAENSWELEDDNKKVFH
jgi:hypothetical protein